ncbi:hypothetical protein AMATHDRAFT_148188 [Amanita thiersii Skay4041]|uniref:Maintenance of telomere capping protein 1 n=1 Tax=Amanita thiersii Skay4041 TaxID=703135 RepID=A0A2A9NF36_9AGAR|nr:hypothetical protein AMATHDRAFT_148188 [Amanita thiersii Skay4041]
MTTKSKSKQEEALQFLDDLDSFAPASDTKPDALSNSGAPPEGEAAEVLAFLDEITQKSTETARSSTPSNLVPDRPSRVGTPSLRKSTERVRLGGGTSSAFGSTTSVNKPNSPSVTNNKNADYSNEPEASTSNNSNSGGWGWGSVWSTASAAIQQARSAVDEQVKTLPGNEQARKWGEGVIEYARSAQLDKLGQDFKRVGLSTLTDILNVVAPPISEHEVIRVWLSHDMQGYDGVESLTYRSLARVMEQVEGGDLIVNRGNESRPKNGSSAERDLNAVDDHEAALKLSEANVEEMMKRREKAEQPKVSSLTSPTTYSDVYIRVQPFSNMSQQDDLQFLIYLSDPVHQLVHLTVTQSVPQRWLSMWDEYDWVEDLVAEVLRVGIEVIGQEYVVSRMGWMGKQKGVEQQSTDEAQDS